MAKFLVKHRAHITVGTFDEVVDLSKIVEAVDVEAARARVQRGDCYSPVLRKLVFEHGTGEILSVQEAP